MKKWITLTLVFILAFVFVGCKPDVDDDDDLVNATAVTISGAKAEIEIAEEMQLTAAVVPSTAVQTVNWSTSDAAISTVDATGKVVGVAAGTVEIKAAAASNSKIFKSINVTVNAPVVVIDPTSVELTGTKTEVTMGSNITLVATVLPEGASQEVTFASSDEAIATVSSIGRVTGVAIGTVTITATVVANNTLTDTYEVTVIEEVIIPVDTDPEEIVIQGEDQMQVDTSILLVASVLPTGVNQNVTWSSSNAAIATVTAGGEVTALAEGTVYIIVTSTVDTNITMMHKIVVKPAPIVEPYPNLGGYQIKIMAAGHAMFEHDPFLELYTGLDKTAKQTAWLEVETNFNCDLAVVAYPDVAPWGPSRISWLNEKAALNAAETDIFVSTTDWVKVLVDGGSVADVLEYYTLYGQNQMSAVMRAAATYKGGLYALPTVAAAGLQVDSGIFYNVAFVERLGLESPAKLFNEGGWTYTGFTNWVTEADALLAEGQTVLSGRPFYYWQGMVNAGGVKLADTLTQSMNLKHPYGVSAATILRNLYNLGWGTNAWDAAATSFNEGNSIMQGGNLWFVRTDNRWPSTLWDAGGNSRFGYVPFPYPDALTKDNTRIGGVGGACYMQAAGRVYPVGVTAKDVYRAFTEMMLNTTKYVKADPTYSEDGIMTTAAESKVDDPESVIALVYFKRDKVIFDPLWTMLTDATYIGPAIDQIVTLGSDYNEIMDAQMSVYQARMVELYS